MSNLATLKKKAAEFEQKRQYDRALEAYEEVLRLQEGTEDADVALYNRVGDMQLRLGRASEALRSYERAVDLYSDRGFLNNAIALCNKILRQDPLRAPVHYKLGRASAIKGFRSDARRHLVEYAALMQKGGRADEAFAALAELVEVGSDTDDLRLLLVEQLERHGRTADAIAQLARVADNADRAGRSADASAARERIQALDPNYAAPAPLAATLDPAPEGGPVAYGGAMPELVLIEPTSYDSDRRRPSPTGVEMPLDIIRGVDVDPADAPSFAMPDVEGSAYADAYDAPAHVESALDAESPEVADAASGRDVAPLETEAMIAGTDDVDDPRADAESEASQDEGPDLVLHLHDDVEAFDDEDVASAELTFIDIHEAPAPPVADLTIADGFVLTDPDESPADVTRPVRAVAPTPALHRAAFPTPNAVRPVPTTPISSRPVADDPAPPATGFIDLGELLRDDTGPRSTRMVTEERAPSGDEQADFAVMLRKFKQGVSEHVDDEDYDSHYDLGIAYREMGLVDEAIAAFQRALRGTTRRARTYEALGQCFLERGQHSVAMSVLRRAVEEGNLGDEQLVGVFYLLGRTAEAMNQRDDAVRYYERVLAVDITFSDVADRMGLASQVPR